MIPSSLNCMKVKTIKIKKVTNVNVSGATGVWAISDKLWCLYTGVWFWVITLKAQHFLVIQINCWNGENLRSIINIFFFSCSCRWHNFHQLTWHSFFIYIWLHLLLCVSLSGWHLKFSEMSHQMRSEFLLVYFNFQLYLVHVHLYCYTTWLVHAPSIYHSFWICLMLDDKL